MSKFVSIAAMKKELQKNGSKWTKRANKVMEASLKLKAEDKS